MAVCLRNAVPVSGHLGWSCRRQERKRLLRLRLSGEGQAAQLAAFDFCRCQLPLHRCDMAFELVPLVDEFSSELLKVADGQS